MRVAGEDPTAYEAIRRLKMGDFVMMIEEFLKRVLSEQRRAKNSTGKPTGSYLNARA